MIRELIPLSEGTLNVLNELIRVDKIVNLSDLGRATGISVAGVLKIVNKLEGSGIVRTEKLGKSTIVSPVYDSKNTWIFSILEKYNLDLFLSRNKELRSLIIELRRNLNEISDFSIIFGSYASGEVSDKSDLDILVVCEEEKEELVLNKIKENSILTNIELSPIVIGREDFIENYRKNHRLYSDIVSGKRVLINGEEKFWDLALEII
ncbi:MAG: hypothetical protein GF368_02990 [Candidatus Aenigmarchaeota archaeon]|nr:hypothetical protein [Candidatus Aenigmarchaeota archaeon]